MKSSLKGRIKNIKCKIPHIKDIINPYHPIQLNSVYFKPNILNSFLGGDIIRVIIGPNINPFNSSSEFYLDVCNKYTTPTNDDIYLQERKYKYYPDLAFCEENCDFIKFNLDNYKITCKCKPKNITNDYENYYL